MRFNLRLHGRTAEGQKCRTDISVYANSQRDLRRQADKAAKSAAWLAEAAPYDPITPGSQITIERVEKI